MKQYISKRWISALLGMWFALTLLVVALIPASWWFVVNSVHVDSVPFGAPITMTVDREIQRPFLGTFTATLKQWQGGWVSMCYATRTLDYTPESKLPADMDLGWWTDGECASLLPGKWMLITTWTIESFGWLPSKQVTFVAEPFEIGAIGE